MEHATTTNGTYSDAQALIYSLLPNCKNLETDGHGPCYYPADTGLGFVVYNGAYKQCLTEYITLPVSVRVYVRSVSSMHARHPTSQSLRRVGCRIAYLTWGIELWILRRLMHTHW